MIVGVVQEGMRPYVITFQTGDVLVRTEMVKGGGAYRPSAWPHLTFIKVEGTGKGGSKTLGSRQRGPGSH